MHSWIEQLVIQKMNQVTAEELYQYASHYGIPVTRQQAKNIAARVKNKGINPFQPQGQSMLRQILDDEIGASLAADLEKKFVQWAQTL